MSNCIIYARVNKNVVPNKEHSIQGQLEACEAYAKENNMTVVGTYSDVLSGTASFDERNGLMDAMLAAVRTGGNILVTNTDRISRRVSKNIAIRRHLANQGCKVIAVENPCADAEEVFMDSILANISTYFSRLED